VLGRTRLARREPCDVPARRDQRRRRLPRLTARRLAAVLLVLVGFLYYRPITTYFHTRAEVDRRTSEVRMLRAQRRTLSSRFAATSSALTLAREARQLSLVQPGETLYVVSGVERWRRAHARQLR
jgi:septum formation initiator